MAKTTVDRTHVVRVGNTMYSELVCSEVDTQDRPVSTPKYEFCQAWEAAGYPEGRKLARIELTDAGYRYLQYALFCHEDKWQEWEDDGPSLLRTAERLIEQAPDGYQYTYWDIDEEWKEVNPRFDFDRYGPDGVSFKAQVTQDELDERAEKERWVKVQKRLGIWNRSDWELDFKAMRIVNKEQ